MYEWFLLPHSSGCGRRLFTRRGAMTPRLADCGAAAAEEKVIICRYNWGGGLRKLRLQNFTRKFLPAFICIHLHRTSYDPAPYCGTPLHCNVIQVIVPLKSDLPQLKPNWQSSWNPAARHAPRDTVGLSTSILSRPPAGVLLRCPILYSNFANDFTNMYFWHQSVG